MDMLTKLEAAVETLLQHNCELREENFRLRQAEEGWQQEKRQLVAEIDRMIDRIDSVQETHP